jgi:hypothetical protein
MVTIEELTAQIEASATRFRFVHTVIQLDQTRFSVKYRLVINPELWVQAYYNIQNDTVGLALIYQGRRLYGRDCEAARWHRHPADDPERHDFSSEGARPTTMEDFLLEVGQVLMNFKLI